MANENKDVLRVEASAAALSANVRNKQVGFETDGTFRQMHKRAGGQAEFWTPDGYQFATGIQYTHSDYPTVGNVKDGLDAAFAGITGIQTGGGIGATGAQGVTGISGVAGTAGFTGLTDNYIPRKASDGKLINSRISSTDGGNTVIDAAAHILLNVNSYLPDNQSIVFGDGVDGNIYSDGTYTIITSGVSSWRILCSMTMADSKGLAFGNLGGPPDANIFSDGTNGIFVTNLPGISTYDKQLICTSTSSPPSDGHTYYYVWQRNG
jgi:hypothetical protein